MANGTGAEIYDVIVIGAGSAGSIVAGKLAAETEAQVLVLEDGGRDWSPLIRIPAGFSKLLEYKQFMYPYETVPQRQLGGRRIPLVQGRGIGGGGSINAMVWMVGQPRDYDRWQMAVGDTGSWSFADMLTHFRAMEGNDTFAGPRHGTSGPLKVSQPLAIVPINRAVLKAFQQVGLPYNPDYNGAEQRGVGPCQLNIGDAERYSSARAYLHPAEERPNLSVWTDALVTRVIVEGDRAVGVEVVRSGRVESVFAAEIVLSAGALSTPRLLMLSGIGPEAELAKHGIELKVRSDDVGRHLQDHPEVPVIAQSHVEMGYLKDSTAFGAFKAGLRYVGTKSGPAASNGIETVAHFNPEFPDEEPTVQCFHAPVIARRALGDVAGVPQTDRRFRRRRTPRTLRKSPETLQAARHTSSLAWKNRGYSARCARSLIRLLRAGKAPAPTCRSPLTEMVTGQADMSWRMSSAPLCANPMTAAPVLALTMFGMTEASMTRSPRTPRTRSDASTTASSPEPMRHVPTGCSMHDMFCRAYSARSASLCTRAPGRSSGFKTALSAGASRTSRA